MNCRWCNTPLTGHAKKYCEACRAAFEPNRRDSASATMTRRVWAYVTRHPLATVREIGQAVPCSYSQASAAIRRLRRLGYVTSTHGKVRARQVIVGLWEVREYR